MERPINIETARVIKESTLSFDRTVSKQLTHKRHIENVYCTEIRETSPDKFLAGAFIPQTNMFFRQCPEPEERNILLLTEIGRQAAIAISHKFFGIPFTKAFVLDRFEILTDPAQIANESLSPASLTVRIVMKDKVINTEDELMAVSTTFQFYQEGLLIGEGISNWSFHEKTRYKKLRSIMRRKMVSRAIDGSKVQESNVVPFEALDFSKVLSDVQKLSDTDYQSGLIVDKNHIFFFEHECDHVPGMLFLESFKQIASRAAEDILNLPSKSVRAHEIGLNFNCFAELDFETQIEADFSEAVVDRQSGVIKSIFVKAIQNGIVLAEGEISVSRQR